MSSDPKKKKLQSIQESIEKLQNSLVMAKGNKRQEDSIQRCILAFQRLIKDIKAK
jgi:hypothetical protein